MVSGEKWLEIFIKLWRFEILWVRKNGFYNNTSVVVCKHDRFRRNYRIGLRCGTLLEAPKREDELNNWLFFTNNAGIIHQTRFYKNQKFNFPNKIYVLRKKFNKQNCLFQRNLQMFSWPFFHRSHIFCLLMINVIKNKNFRFSWKPYEIQKYVGNKIVYLKKIFKFISDHFFYGTRSFRFFCQKRLSKNWKSNFPTKIYVMRKKV